MGMFLLGLAIGSIIVPVILLMIISWRLLKIAEKKPEEFKEKLDKLKERIQKLQEISE